LGQELSVTIRMIERLERPLLIDEVREGLPTIGWTLVREDEDYFIESSRLPGVQPGTYHVLVAEAEGRVAFAGFFNDEGELQMQEYHHIHLDVSLPLPNAQHGVFSAEWAVEVLARRAEGAVGPPSNWRLINKE
jgi:hypothetical protein